MEQSKNKKVMLQIIGVAILVIGLVGITYAFFNYTRTGTANIIKTGRVSFNSEQGTAINLTNLFPIDVSEGIPNDATKVGTVTINITGDTTYGEGIEYLVSAVNVTNTVGSKSLPISIDVGVASNTENSPATTLGTSSSDYYNDRGSTTSYYSVLASDVIENNDQLVVGYIAPGATGVDGNIVIKAYLDASKVAISDTYPSGIVRTVKTTGYSSNDCETVLDGVTNASTYCATAASLQSSIDNEDLTSAQITLLVSAGIVEEYTDGTTSTWVGDRTVFTTTEWNSLQTNGVSFQVKVEANEGIWVEEIIIPICRRVTNPEKLHVEKCTNQTNYLFCQKAGYSLNSDITYGNAVSLGTNTLTVGDAFDCDVNGNGVIDEDGTGMSTERFYYVSPYYDTENESFDNTYATLIYYSNTVNGVASSSGASYDSNNINYEGPVTAKINLPSTSTWSNVSLKTSSRTIWGCDHNCSNPELTTTGGLITPNPYSYTGYSARLLTMQELDESGCVALSGKSQLMDALSLKACDFLLEGTRYADNSKETSGIWFENPRSEYSDSFGWCMTAGSATVNYQSNVNDTNYGVRPVIDVPVAKIAK